jgi:hypothetical protein
MTCIIKRLLSTQLKEEEYNEILEKAKEFDVSAATILRFYMRLGKQKGDKIKDIGKVLELAKL